MRGLLILTVGVDFLGAISDGELTEPTVLFARQLLGRLVREHALQDFFQPRPEFIKLTRCTVSTLSG